MLSRNYYTSISAAIVCVLAGATSAQADTEVTFCNKTGSKVTAAIGYLSQADQKWTLSAWYAVPAGGCKSVGKLRTGLFYYYAEKEGRKFHWPAASGVDKDFCVPDTSIKRVMVGGACSGQERKLGFKGTVPNEGRYTVNLT